MRNLGIVSLSPETATKRSDAPDLHVAANSAGAAENVVPAFLRALATLPGVTGYEWSGMNNFDQSTVIVYVRDGDRETERAVYRVEGETLNQNPGADFQVLVLPPRREVVVAGEAVSQ